MPRYCKINNDKLTGDIIDCAKSCHGGNKDMFVEHMMVQHVGAHWCTLVHIGGVCQPACSLICLSHSSLFDHDG